MPPLGPRRATALPVRRAKSPPPVTDVQSTHGYDVGRGAHSHAFHTAMTHVFEAQTPAVQHKMVLHALKRPQDIENKVILNHVARRAQTPHPADIHIGQDLKRANAFKAQQAKASKPGFLDRVVHSLLHPGSSVIGTETVTTSAKGHRLPGATASPGLVAGTPTQSLPALVIKNVGQATFEHPGAVLGHTAKGLGDIAIGTPAAVGELVGGTVGPLAHGHAPSLHPFGRYVSAMAKDYSRRYGPLVKGDEKAFRDRIVKEGAASELLDAATITGIGGAAAGRALGTAARAGKLGERLGAIATTRPALRVSGDLARAQEVHPNLFRAVMQAGQDTAREKVRGIRPRTGRSEGLQPRVPEGPVTSAGDVAKGQREVVPILQGRIQRIAVSKRAARSFLANKREQHATLNSGVERDLAGMSAAQREGVFHSMSGIVPLARREGETDANYLARVEGEIKARRAAIQAHHKANPKDPVPVHPKAELHTLDRLQANLEQTFGDGKLAAFHAKYQPLSHELAAGDPGVADAAAALHPYRVQGEHLGIKYEPPGEGATGEEIAAHNDAYVARVRAAAAQRGLPEPAYFRHQEFPTSGFSARTASNLYKAVQASKRSELKLFRRGAAITDPDVFVQGLAGNIKRRHQWNAVADTLDAHAMPWSRGTSGAGRSLLDLKREIQRQNLDPRDFEFVNFGRFRRFTETADALDTPKSLRGALKTAVEDHSALEDLPETELAATRGYVAVPKGVGDELKEAIRPAGKPTRVIGKVQGFTSGAILGLNPSWLQMQVAANALQYGMGARGNFKDLLTAPGMYRALPEAQRAMLDEHIGVGVGTGHTTHPHLGSQGGSLAQAGRRIGQVPIVRSKRGTIRVTDINPTRPLFAIDNAQNRAYRLASVFDEAKRRAYKNIRKEMGLAAEVQTRVSNVLRLRPDETLQHQLDRVLANRNDIEKLGEHVDRVLGDYVRYTARERRYLKPTVLFYGFMRYALKSLFYTLPIRHPIATSIVGHLGELHDEEVRRIFGTRDIPPWVLSRVFGYKADGSVTRDKQGRIHSVDLGRINPVTSPATDLVEQGPKALGSLMSPLVQAAIDQVYARSSFTGQGWHVHGLAEDNPNPDYVTRGRIAINQLGQVAYPYRELLRLTQRGTQGEDTLLGSPRPIHYKTAGTQAEEADRRANAPKATEELASSLFPFGFPKVDTTEANLRRKKKKGGGGGGSFDFKSAGAAHVSSAPGGFDFQSAR